MEREKPTREGRILKAWAGAEIIGGVGVIFLSSLTFAGAILLASGGFKYFLLNRLESDDKNKPN
jgi:hypothetical protein